jgi:tetratricopeptide (TPR) repeat protein
METTMGAIGFRKWRAPTLAALSGAAAIALFAAWYFRPRQPVPEIPFPDLTGIDPAVAQVVEAAQAAVREAPRSADAWGHLGRVLLAHAFEGEAQTCFAAAERLAPREPRWPYYQGITLSLSSSEAAVAKLRRALDLGGDASGAARLRLGDLLLKAGRLEEAEEQFRLLLQREPANPRAALGLAQVAWERGAPEQSLTHLRRAVDSPFTRKKACHLLAEVYQQQGDRAAAERALQRAAQLPDDQGWVDSFLGEVEQLRVGIRTRLEEANRLLEQGKVDEAVAFLQQAARDYPEADAVWVSLGRALVRQGNLVAAERTLRRAVEIAPEAAEARFQLGVALFSQKAYPAAADCFRKAVELKPAHALAYYNLGHCLMLQDDRAGAIEAFGGAVRCRPQFAEAHTNLADLLLQEGRQAEAREHVSHALRLNPGDERARQLWEKLK